MAIYYVKSSGGDDTDTGLSVGNAWATLQHALDTVPKNNQIYVLDDGTHTPSAPIDLDTNLGTASQPIDIYGADASGNLHTRGNMTTISGSGLAAGEDIVRLNQSTGTNYIRMRNLRLTASPQSAISFASSTGKGYIIMNNCRLDNNGYNGVEVGRSGSPNPVYIIALDCEFDNNSNDGLGFIITNRGDWHLSGCRIHNNGNDGVSLRRHSWIEDCLIYSNTRYGILGGSGIPVRCSNCTIYNNGSHGIYDSAGYPNNFVNHNIIANNGGYGYYPNNNGNGGIFHHQLANLYHNNTSGPHRQGSSPIPGILQLSGDPLFISTNESDDNFLVVAANSPAKGAGANGNDIGARIRETPTVGFSI